MPKQLETYNPFGGGINSKDDPRDISKNELVNSLNVMVDAIGRVRTLGKTSDVTNATSSSLTRGADGTGVFSYQADVDFNSSTAAADPDNPTEYIALYDSDDNTIMVYPNTSDALVEDVDDEDSNNFDLGTKTGSIVGECTFYYADNALRAMNGNFENKDLYMKWFGYINKRYFRTNSTTWLDTFGPKWYVRSNTLTNPSKGFWSPHAAGSAADAVDGTSDNTHIGIDTDVNESNMSTLIGDSGSAIDAHIASDGSADYAITGSSSDSDQFVTAALAASAVWDAKSWTIHPPAGTGFNVDLNVTSSTDSMWRRGGYVLGQTFVYVGEQESRVGTMAGGSFTIDADEYPQVTVMMTRPYDERVKGGRIYIKSTQRGEPWRLLLDIDFEKGIRMSTNSEFDYFNSYSHDSNIYVYSDTYDIKIPSPETFNTINGYSPTGQHNAMGWQGYGAKSAVVANQRAFIANIKDGKDTDFEKVHTNRILYSPVNQYDVFPESYYLDIGSGDGEIIQMLDFSDRLLVFKEKKLYIVNIGSGSDGGWFLEEEYPYKGIDKKAAAFKASTGCVWANKNGCYFFDGKAVTDLTEKLDDDKWKTFMSDTTPMVGYIPTKDQVIVVKDAGMSASGDNECYIYDMRTKSWVRAQSDNLFEQASNRGLSNFVIYNNSLAWAVETGATASKVSILEPDLNTGSPATHAMNFMTKDEDFGQPSIKKNFYKVYVNYRNNNGSTDAYLRLYYSTNGATSTATPTSWSAVSNETLEADNEWHIAEFTPSSTIQGQSISLYFATVDDSSSGTTATEANIDINEVTIEWRPMRKRAPAA